MVRDFSKAKKEELYRALELIDDREWKPFMAWCGGRAAEFGEWADRLSISTYTRQVDNYQNRVLEVNDSTRNQIDITFEGVAETDGRYAQIFRGHAETVREQIRRVQTMLQVMQSANRNGTDIGTIAYGINSHPDVSYMERFENGQRVLLNYLKVRGVTDPAKQQEICDWIMGNQMHMLEKLYEADYYGSVNAGTIYNSLMDCYIGYKTEIVFMSYLNENEITDLAEQQKIYGMIVENQPSMLRNLYMAVEQNHEGADAIFYSIMDYYVSTKYKDVDYIMQQISEEDVSTYEEMFSLNTYDLLARMIFQEMQNPKNGGQSKVLWATINRYFSEKNFTNGKEQTLRIILEEGKYTSINYNRGGVFNAYHPDYDSAGWENAKRLAAILYSQVGEANATEVDEEKIREEISASKDIYGNNIENTIGNCDSFYAGKGENIFYEYGN